MKALFNILLILLTTYLCACQDDVNSLNGKGYLRLSIEESSSTNSRSEVPEDYKPKQLAVQIVDVNNQVVKKTEDWTLWEDSLIALKPGVYTIKVASNGFDGKAADFDIPYYAGSETVTVENGKEVQKRVVCTLANVKVTVKFDLDFVSKFKSMTVQVGDVEGKYTPLNFTTSETRSAYFPVVSLFSKISVTNNNGVIHSLKKEFTDVKARDHYILNYKLAETGSSNITVTVDPTTHEYTYTFTVSPEAVNRTTLSAGAWDRLAYLKAESVSAESGTSLEGLKFQIRTKISGEGGSWTDVSATGENGAYTGFATGLTASTEYEYRLVNKDEVVIGATQSFTTATTDAQTALYNGNFDSWYTNGKVIYAISEADAGINGSDSKGYLYSFWDSGNVGASTMNANPTSSEESIVHTSGGKSAKLASTWVGMDMGFTKIGKFAAGNLYTGHYVNTDGTNGAQLDFGQPFTSRPTALKGYYQYAPGSIDYVGDKQPANTVEKGNTDIGSIFIALTTEVYPIDNTNPESGLFDKNNDRVIAYGELPADQCVSTNGTWKEFNIPLEYKEEKFDVIPTHIVIVCSASKYGDYFTGSTNSVMYLDDFSLVYDGTPTIWENK